MNKKAKNILLTTLALILFVGFMVGIGFIWDLFWTIDKTTKIIYWVSKGLVCLMVVVFSIIMLLDKSDKGVGSMQLFFTISLAFLPIVLRALCMIPVAGKYIAIILGFIIFCLYAITMIGMFGYNNGEDTKRQ